MKYYEAIADAILKIELRIDKPVKLECNIRDKSVGIYVLESGKWILLDTVLDFVNVSHLEVEQFILGSIEQTDGEQENS